MSAASWLHLWKGRIRGNRQGHTHCKASRQGPSCLRLEQLEDRAVPSVSTYRSKARGKCFLESAKLSLIWRTLSQAKQRSRGTLNWSYTGLASTGRVRKVRCTPP